MQKLLLTVSAALLLASVAFMMMPSAEQAPSNFYQGWIQWKMTHGKAYATADEDLYRFNVWTRNLKWIEENQGAEYTLEMNGFGDLTKEEFKATYLMNVPLPEKDTSRDVHFPEGLQLNSTVNWVSQGNTVSVLNQGQCGSCWAFSATEQLDSSYSMKGTKPVPNYSEQQVVSCSGSYGNQGCNGGWPVNAYKYMEAHPLCTNAQYPYVSGTTQNTGICNNAVVSQCATNGGSPTTYATLPTGNCGALETAVNSQPISVCVDASTWSYYKSGVFSNCGTQLDHCVLAVGYVEGSYWIIQNSWGTSWGQQGFIWLKWGNTCGVCQQAQYATAK